MIVLKSIIISLYVTFSVLPPGMWAALWALIYKRRNLQLEHKQYQIFQGFWATNLQDCLSASMWFILLMLATRAAAIGLFIPVGLRYFYGNPDVWDILLHLLILSPLIVSALACGWLMRRSYNTIIKPFGYTLKPSAYLILAQVLFVPILLLDHFSLILTEMWQVKSLTIIISQMDGLPDWPISFFESLILAILQFCLLMRVETTPLDHGEEGA